MKNTFYFIITFAFLSCKSAQKVEDIYIDEYITLCFENELFKRVNLFNEEVPKHFVDSLINMHTHFETFLINEKVLNDDSKNSYKKLFEDLENQKINMEEIKTNFIEKLKFYPDPIFEGGGTQIPKVCIANAYLKYDLYKKGSWRYNLILAMDGDSPGIKSKYIETQHKIINTIPDNKFNIMVYKAYLLNYLYLGLYNDK
ncbi:hypothetical protein E7Z59_07050 [Robertkochia marina]|uniref:Uncharacterized protein n=1 Tax=Robertkochia marina TaxID=1227945 RepID=A0A4S3LZ88_9FLAO|nr:hypothetical protein [Robertkochia marina]THD67412.1 hypothetical protein E7Z59_07050 [Robertkochia marina]